MFLFSKTKLFNFLIESLLFSLILFLFLGIVLNNKIGDIINSFEYRMLFVPSEYHYYYYDYLSIREKLYFRQSFLRYFFSDPYPDTLSVLIGSDRKYNFSGSYSNANNGLFSDAYANLGLVGVFIYPIIISLSILFLSRQMKKISPFAEKTISVMLLMSLMSAGLLQLIITGGVLILLIILAIIKVKKSFNFGKVFRRINQ